MNTLFIIAGTIAILLLIIFWINLGQNRQLVRPQGKGCANTGNIGIGMPAPTKDVHIKPNNSKCFQISVERFNELIPDADWVLVDYYIKHDCNTYLWANKETGKLIEGLNSYQPMRKLNLNGL